MIDALLVLSGTFSSSNVLSGQAITVDAPSTNVWDLISNRDVGAGKEINFNFLVTTTFETLVSMTISIQSSADNITYVDLLRSPLLLLASLTAGTSLIYTLPRKQLNDPAGGTPNRYLRAYYDVNTDATAGAIACWISGGEDAPAYTSYPRNYTAP